MKSAKIHTMATRSAWIAGNAALLMLGAIGFAGTSHARDSLSFSVGIGLPGVAVGVSNAYPVYSQPVYLQPVYVQPQPVYLQPRSVYVQPVPIYVQPGPVYYQSAPVYYARPHGQRRHNGHNDGYYVQPPRPAYGPGFSGQRYAPVYYQR